GVVVSPEGAPIEGATIRCALQAGPGSVGQMNGQSGQIIATTDAAGRFRFDSLDDGAQYAMLVETKDFGRRLFIYVAAGESDLKWTVGPDLVVHGRVLGDLSELSSVKGKPTVSYGQPISVQRSPDFTNSFTLSGQSDVEPIDGEGRFTIENLVPG